MTLPSDGLIEDRPHAIGIEEEKLSFSGFRNVETITYSESDGRLQATREIVRARRAVGVIAFDPVLDRLVLIRQFRLAAQMGTGQGFCTEIVAGLIEDGRDGAQTARAELREEAGLEAKSCQHLFSFLTSPGMTDEVLEVFCCRVDAAHLPERGGLDEETEETFPFTCTLEEALAAIDTNAISHGIAMLALLRFSRMKDDIFG